MYTINVQSTDYLILSEVLLINYLSIDIAIQFIWGYIYLLAHKAADVRVQSDYAMNIMRKLLLLRQNER